MNYEYISMDTLEENRKLLGEVERLRNEKQELQEENEELELELSGYRKAIMNNDILLGLQQRIDKAIEYLKINACYTDNNEFDNDLIYDNCKELLNILNGDSDE